MQYTLADFSNGVAPDQLLGEIGNGCIAVVNFGEDVTIYGDLDRGVVDSAVAAHIPIVVYPDNCCDVPTIIDVNIAEYTVTTYPSVLLVFYEGAKINLPSASTIMSISVVDMTGNASYKNISVVPHSGDLVNGDSVFYLNGDYSTARFSSTGSGSWYIG